MIDTSNLTGRLSGAFVASLILIWLAVACLWLDKPGLQYDETIFVSGTYPETSGGARWVIELMGAKVAVLVMSYMGALKGWLYRGILTFTEPSAAAVRIPMLLLAAATLAGTYKLAAAMFNRSTGLVAVCLLATDSTYLFTSRMDWGPVVIQRMCLVFGTLLVLTGSLEKLSRWRVVAGAAVFGVALFDKLTFLWVLGGLCVALAITHSATVARLADRRLLPLCLAALLLPVAPAMYFRTFVANADTVTIEQHSDDLLMKYRMFTQALDGTVLQGVVAHIDGPEGLPEDSLQALLYDLDTPPFLATSWFRFALVLALVLLPATTFLPGGRRRAFVTLSCVFALLFMAFIEGVGSVHHTTLIYPFPHILVASSLVAISDWMRRSAGPASLVAVVVATFVLAASGVLRIADQYRTIVQFGGGPVWSEAIYGLAATVEDRAAPHVLVGDWGIEHQLILLSKNRLSTSALSFGDPDDPDAVDAVAAELARPGSLLVRYASVESSPSPSQHELANRAAQRAGVEFVPLDLIRDRQGRAVFAVYRVINSLDPPRP